MGLLHPLSMQPKATYNSQYATPASTMHRSVGTISPLISLSPAEQNWTDPLWSQYVSGIQRNAGAHLHQSSVPTSGSHGGGSLSECEPCQNVQLTVPVHAALQVMSISLTSMVYAQSQAAQSFGQASHPSTQQQFLPFTSLNGAPSRLRMLPPLASGPAMMGHAGHEDTVMVSVRMTSSNVPAWLRTIRQVSFTTAALKVKDEVLNSRLIGVALLTVMEASSIAWAS